MIAKTNSATGLGVYAHSIEVEVDLSVGLSQFNIVGLPYGTSLESRDRILAGLVQFRIQFTYAQDHAQPRSDPLAQDRF